jgi:hypothetical protein
MNSSIEILDSIVHQELNIDFKVARRAARKEIIPVVISEFHSLMFHYPILFVKDADTGEFACSILLGVSAEANLLDTHDMLSDESLPLNIRRQPLLAIEAQVADEHPLIGINRSIPGIGVGNGEGDYIFKDKSDAFESAVAAVGEIYESIKQTKDYVKKLIELDLISKLNAEIHYEDKPKLTLDGLYAIDANKIARINEFDAKDKDLFLEIASYVYAQNFSLYNMKKLAPLVS